MMHKYKKLPINELLSDEKITKLLLFKTTFSFLPLSLHPHPQHSMEDIYWGRFLILLSRLMSGNTAGRNREAKCV